MNSAYNQESPKGRQSSLNLPIINLILNDSTSPHRSTNSIDRRLLNKQFISENNNFPLYITKDDPKPATFIVRKLFSDFVTLASKKIETILLIEQNVKDKSIFRLLDRDQDLVYNQILEALGAVCEFCLPSLLEILIAWYHHQLDVDEHTQKKQANNNNFDTSSTPYSSSIPTTGNNHQNNLDIHQLSDCGSPCDDTLISNSSLFRSPTPSSPDITSNQVSITSTLPLEYQSPSLTIVSGGGGGTANDLHTSSAANTSTSTATNVSSNSLTENPSKSIQRLEMVKTRKLLIEYIFCQALIEIFSQLNLHPGHEDLISQVEDIAFEHFIYTEGNELNNIDIANINLLADKYAEVIGVLAQTRFKSVKKRFMAELNDLKAKEPTPYNIQCIVTLLSGIKYFRVKMAPIEDFEASFQFLQECAEYFLEVRHKSVRHALAILFVEIMVPLASIVKNEVKIPCLKNFVDTLWPQTLDMCSRKKHSITLFPLVTCLLCVSQKTFFLTNWSGFLNMCLSNLKNRDQKMCRVALESLYRLIWVYMIRVRCESNNVTQAKLHSIVDALFPKGSRSVVPRDAPLSIFVDIIHFIAQERLDFAIRHIIYDLLSVERPTKVVLAPERMNIALQAFLLIADSLQQKEGEPTIPKSVGLSASDTISAGRRRTNINKMLNDDTAKSIGIYQYHAHIQKSFNDILKALDTQYGKPLLLTVNQNMSKEPDSAIKSERKPKIDLFKTCILAIPRLMPEGMSKSDLIDLLSRMTIHIDEEMRKYAFESLQILVTDFADWRLDAIEGFTTFFTTQINDSFKPLIDNCLKMLLQLLLSWKGALSLNNNSNGYDSGRASSVVSIQTGYETISSRSGGTGGQIAARKNRALAEMRLIQSELSNTQFERLIGVIQKVEAAALIMLCNCNQPTRKIASHLLRESRSILKCYSSWTCMEQFGFRSPEDVEEDDLSASLRGSLSADNLSRITTTSANGPLHCSVTSMNTQALLTTSVSKMCINSTQANQNNNSTNYQHHQHDPYDSDLENNLADCFASDDNCCIIFWLSVIMLESDNENEYMLALRLLKRILPNLPFEQPSFVDDIEKTFSQMNWKNFPGIHALVLRGCTSAETYEISIALLDQITPILKLFIFSVDNCETYFPFHVIILLTYLLAHYDDPTSFCLNIARRIAIWCDENGGQKLDNLSTVMNLYSRRSFSKDSFQWTKCVIKYLFDAHPKVLPKIFPMLVKLLEDGCSQVQRLIAPILYCLFNYVDISSQIEPVDMNADLGRIYCKYLNGGNEFGSQWKDAVQLFKLIISRSSHLATRSSFSQVGRGELPGRTMEFSLDVDSMPIIGKSQLGELALEVSGNNAPCSGVGTVPVSLEQQQQQITQELDDILLDSQQEQATRAPSSLQQHNLLRQDVDGDHHHQQQQQQQQPQVSEQNKWRRSWLAHSHIRERLISLLMS